MRYCQVIAETQGLIHFQVLEGKQLRNDQLPVKSDQCLVTHKSWTLLSFRAENHCLGRSAALLFATWQLFWQRALLLLQIVDGGELESLFGLFSCCCHVFGSV